MKGWSANFGNGSLPSSADLSGSEGLWGAISAGAVGLATVSGTAHGIITDGGTASGDEVGLSVGVVEVIFGATVAVGDAVVNEVTTARTITATTTSFGVALTGGADGEKGFILCLGTDVS